jgi:hypothetical protein
VVASRAVEALSGGVTLVQAGDLTFINICNNFKKYPI